MWSINKLSKDDIKYLDNKLNFKSIINHFGYIELLKKIGWQATSLLYKKDSQIKSFCNIFLKKRFGFFLFYIPGGIEGFCNKKNIKELTLFINHLMKGNKIIFINLHNEFDDSKLLPKNYIKVFNLHETRMVMKKNLFDYESIEYKYSKNWRHNLNRSKKKEFKIEKLQKPNIDEMIILYEDMSKIKKYKINISKNYLEDLFYYLKENIIYYEARVSGKLIAFRAVYFFGINAWDLLACSNQYSKKNYCTYKIMDNIFYDLRKLNIKNFDFSGVDKVKNLGVYNFKKGAGSKEFLKFGEYVYSKNIILKYIFLSFIFFKRIFIK